LWNRGWRTETGELLGGYANAVEDLAQRGSGVGAFFHDRFQDVVKQASPSVGCAMDLERVDRRRGKAVLFEL
jgi:hypothetical protein